MSELRVGQRVHVEFDGVVQKLERFASGRITSVGINDGHPGELIVTVPPRVCTVIPDPVKVGDEVSQDNIEQLPIWSVIAFEGSAAWTRMLDGWSCGGGEYRDESMLISSRRPRVLRIGGGVL